MPMDSEIRIVQKAAMFDLIDIFESNPEKENYTPEEIKTIIKAYLKENAS